MTSLHPAPASMPVVDASYWERGVSLDAFIERAITNHGFWGAARRLATITDEALARIAAIDKPLRLIVLLEDWCGDAVNTIPVIQHLVDGNPLIQLRVLLRDENDALMMAHLTGTSRAIPVVIVTDELGNHFGWWGSRPSPLQRWRILEGNALEKSERYKATRTWYARDRGHTTVNEILELLESASRAGTNARAIV